MNFTTKYTKGDKVWYMKNNKPTEVIISSINIFYCGTSQNHVKYTAMDVRNPVSWLDHTHLHGGTLFISKAKLLESL